MFMRLLYSAIILVFCFMNAGCAGPAHSTSGLSNGLQSDVERLKQDNESCQRIVGEKQAAIDQMNIEITNLNDEVEELRSEVADLKKERQQAGEGKQKNIEKADKEEGLLKDQISPLKEKTITVEDKKSENSGPEKEGVKHDPKADVDKKDAPQTTTVEKGVEPKVLSVKVLSGNGKMSSARAMSEKLKKLGYKIENTGLAPRSNFDVITIYFAPDHKSEAQQVAKQLGGGAIAKPLTWPSGFHVIVVTGP
ncbi:MAG: LytR C-terminal domain-containing protein [Deltaproteobacteria bacterium]